MNKVSAHNYETKLTWTGAGHAGTADYRSYERSYRIDTEGKPELLGSAHPDFRGDPGHRDPEGLFLAAVSACHMLSYLALGDQTMDSMRLFSYGDRAASIMEGTERKWHEWLAERFPPETSA